MKVQGRCHCGEIRYHAQVDPATVTICHCTDCQMLTGSVFRANVPTRAGTFTLLSGAPKIYIKTAESGNKRAHAFCPECGTPIYSAAPVDPQTYSLRIGCLDKRAELKPVKQIWCDSALPWSMNVERIARIARQ